MEVSRFVLVADCSQQLKNENHEQERVCELAGYGVAVAATGGFAGCASKTLANTARPGAATLGNARAGKAVYIPNGKNRFQEELMIWGMNPFQI